MAIWTDSLRTKQRGEVSSEETDFHNEGAKTGREGEPSLTAPDIDLGSLSSTELLNSLERR